MNPLNKVNNYLITFNRDEKVIGKLDFNGPKMVFIGDADESVKVFVEAFNRWFEQRIAQENEACAKVCEDYTDNDGGPFIDHEGHGYECANAIRERLANTKATGEQ
jgi:hypothetical protein